MRTDEDQLSERVRYSWNLNSFNRSENSWDYHFVKSLTNDTFVDADKLISFIKTFHHLIRMSIILWQAWIHCLSIYLCISWRVCQRSLMHPWRVIFRRSHGWLSKFWSESTLNLDSVSLQFHHMLLKLNSKVLLRSSLYVCSFTVMSCATLFIWYETMRFATWNIFQSFFVRWLYSIFDLIFFTCRVGRHFNFTDSLITTTLTYDILKISWMMMDQFSTWTLFTVYLWYSGTDYDMRSARKVVLHCLFLKYVISGTFHLFEKSCSSVDTRSRSHRFKFQILSGLVVLWIIVDLAKMHANLKSCM